MEMKLEILSRETIKPFSPTPPELKTYSLSSFDQQSHLHFYMQKVYFYNNNSEFSSEVLKKSLSKTLVQYYPFAGRVSNDSVPTASAIDCNDEGVSFLEARILNCDMSEIINNLKTKCADGGIFELLFSDNIQGKDQRSNPLLSFQITHFDCGGIAMTLFFSHKVADMATLMNFMNDWASIARSSRDNDNVFSVSPRFDAVSFFPAEDEQPAQTETKNNDDSEKQKFVGNDVAFKRFEFDASQIAKLKGIVGEKVENPTRVEVITALIYKALTNSKNQPTTMMRALNLRSRIVPPLPDSLTGNIATHFIGLSTSKETKEIELWKLVADMKKNLENYCNNYPRKYKKPEEWSSLNNSHKKEIMEWFINQPNQTVYVCNSWCRFPIYETDFGWGKPIWFTLPTSTTFMKNLILLMDTKDDGIEVLVTLDGKDEMAEFETNIKDLFCNLNI